MDRITHRITPEHISDLKENEVFVFGSNEIGVHGAGAARTALRWGAKLGQGVGLQGKTYAIPTKGKNIKTISIAKIKPYVDEFIQFAKNNPKKIFLVTAIGTGLAGIKTLEIAPLFKDAINIENIYLPDSFLQILGKRIDKKTFIDLLVDEEK